MTAPAKNVGELTMQVMRSEERVERIKGIKGKNGSKSSMYVYYKGQRESLPVYRIPMDVLIYNSHNGRIASQVKTREKESGAADTPESQEMQEAVHRYLWESSKRRNKATKQNLFERGQLKPGIVTADGIVVDGNRRLMLLRELDQEHPNGKYSYFEASILDDKLSDNPKEIIRLETIFQMGEDEKVGYGAIEKYLKCEEMRHIRFSVKEIANAMNESEADIKEYLEIMELMNEYLEYCGHEGYYTLLEGTEGIFVDLRGYLAGYRGKQSSRVNWNYDTEADVSDLQKVYFDYIRAQGADEEKTYRHIGRTSNKKNSLFTREEIWKEFLKEHCAEADKAVQEVDKLKQEEGWSHQEFYKEQNKIYQENTNKSFIGRVKKFKNKLDEINEGDAPVILLRRSKDALDKVDPGQEGFYEEEAKHLVKEINKASWNLKKQHDKKEKSSQ